MRIYLDNCILNRQFDDQSQARIKNETQAVHIIRKRITSGELDFVWSYMNEFEAYRNPIANIMESALEWRQMATVTIAPSISIVRMAYELRELGIKPVDSLHIAAAFEANSDYFVTADDGILSKVKAFGDLLVSDPIALVSKLENL